MVAALPLFGAFVVGLGTRRWLRRHFPLLFRLQFAFVGVLAVLAGWAFELSVRNVGAIVVLLVAQVAAVLLATSVFRARTDGPLLAFAMYGNPIFWSVPVAVATFGPRAAAFLVAYDMLTQPRIALAVKLMRRRAPVEQSSRSALADYAPTAGAVAGLVFGLVVPAPEGLATVVSWLGIAMGALGSLLLGVAWPREWAGRSAARVSLRGLLLHLTFVPCLLGVVTLLGFPMPGVAWILAFGPLPVSLVAFARLYGYSTRVAATGLALSVVVALLLLPAAIALGR
jgi:predicted permease